MAEGVPGAAPRGPVAALWFLRRSMAAAPAEWFLAFVGLLCLARTMIEAFKIGYLPMPMIPDPQDWYGDGYNTTWWGMNGHMYDAWLTVYPPFAFVIVRLTAWSKCYLGASGGDTFHVRDCDWGYWIAWMLAFAFNLWSIAQLYWKLNPLTAIPRFLAVALGLPMFYLLERLNLLMFGFTGVILLVRTGVRFGWARWFGIAAAINLKPYLLTLLFPYALQRRWRALEITLLLIVLIWFLSYEMIGAGTPSEVFENIFHFSIDPDRAASWASITYASSWNPMIQFLESRFPLMPHVGSWPLEFWPPFLRLTIRLVQAISAVGFLAIGLEPRALTRRRVLTLCYMMTLCSVEPGGYAMVIGLFLVMLERWEGWERKTAVTCMYLLSFVIAIEWQPLGERWVWSYWANHWILQQNWVTLDPFIRPALLQLAQVALIIRSVRDVIAYRRRERLALFGPMQRPLPA